MTYAIIGFGNVGQALAKMFARKNMEVTVASTHPPEESADKAKVIGPKVAAKTLDDAIKADTLLLAVPFWSHRDVAKTASDWSGKTIVDVMNVYGITPEELGNLPSSTVVANAFKGAKVVKAFNHLLADVLAQDPAVHGGKRVIFMSGDDDAAVNSVAKLIETLGFAPVALGSLAVSEPLVQAHGKSWASLTNQDLVKFD